MLLLTDRTESGVADKSNSTGFPSASTGLNFTLFSDGLGVETLETSELSSIGDLLRAAASAAALDLAASREDRSLRLAAAVGPGPFRDFRRHLSLKFGFDLFSRSIMPSSTALSLSASMGTIATEEARLRCTL